MLSPNCFVLRLGLPQKTLLHQLLCHMCTLSPHTPTAARRGSGTGLLNVNALLFQFHNSPPPTLNLTLSPFHFQSSSPLQIVYRPPGPSAEFLEELDTLVSHFPDDSTRLILFGDFNILTEKLDPIPFPHLLRSFPLSISSDPQGWQPARPYLHQTLLYFEPLCHSSPPL